MIEIDEKNFIIDTGPDFRQQMLREDVDNIHAVLFTHEHKDHIAGLDDIRAFNFLKRKAIDVYAEKRVRRALHREYAYIFAETKYPGIPEIKLHNIDENPITIKGVKIIPIRAMHYRLPILGFRIGDFSYITDANYIPPEEMKKIEGSRIIAINALRKEKHISHFTIDEATAIINTLQPEKAYFIHISHRLGLHDEINKELPENIHLAYDGLQIEMEYRL